MFATQAWRYEEPGRRLHLNSMVFAAPFLFFSLGCFHVLADWEVISHAPRCHVSSTHASEQWG